MKNLISTHVIAGLFAFISMSANAELVFVDSWHVGEGPQYNIAIQPAYSGQEAAALLFGGDFNDYTISTVSNLIEDINYMTWMDQHGIGLGKFAHDFQNGDSYTPNVVSAYILDNSCGHRYSQPSSPCTDEYVNYAFIDNGVPEVPVPAAAWLFGSALAGLGFARRKK